MRLTADALRTLKGKVVTFHDGCDDSAWNSPSIFFPGMKARITRVKDHSKTWWRFFMPASKASLRSVFNGPGFLEPSRLPALEPESPLGFDIVFDYRDFLAWNREVARAMDDETIWTAKEEVWLKSGKCASYLRVGDDFFDVDE
jgi:hypothetical protein